MMLEEARQERNNAARRCAQIRHAIRMYECQHPEDDRVGVHGTCGTMVQYCRACMRVISVYAEFRR